MNRKQILFTINCKNCGQEFVYCIKSGKDVRCYDCKNGMTLEDAKKELEEMDEEEYQSFLDDIKEYEENLKKIKKI
jgi:hypothetical protein